tara:strand:- start:10 stop:174 length:165 start_codon:yes stop_codon:yes gene_type:complete
MNNVEDLLAWVAYLAESIESEIENYDNKENLNELVFTLRDLTKQIDQHLDELEG